MKDTTAPACSCLLLPFYQPMQFANIMTQAGKFAAIFAAILTKQRRNKRFRQGLQPTVTSHGFAMRNPHKC